MSYSPLSLYMDAPALPVSGDFILDEDLRIFQLASFLEAAGWTKTLIGANFTVTTANLQTNSYIFFGGNPANDLFWKLTYNLGADGCYMIVDGASQSSGDVAGCAQGESLTIENPPKTGPTFSSRCILTGDTAPAHVHRGVLIGMLRLFGVTVQQIKDNLQADNSYDGPLVKYEPIDGFNTRVKLKASARNAGAFFNYAANTRSSATASLGGGYICKCQPSKKTFWRNGFGSVTRGDGNYLTIFLTIHQFGLAGGFMAMAGAKDFLPYPSDTPIAAAGPGAATGVSSDYFTWSPYHRVIGFANQYQVIMHAEPPTPDPSPSFVQGPHFVNASALKLMDFRRSYNDDLPITEATLFISGDTAGFRQQLWNSSAWMRMAVNGNARYGGNGQACAFLTPYYAPRYTSGGIPGANVNGFPWEDGCYPGWEPWISMNPFNGANVAPIVGQLWDAFGDHRVTVDPLSEAPFFWDPPSGGVPAQKFRRYTKNSFNNALNIAAGTLCLRASADFAPPAGPPP